MKKLAQWLTFICFLATTALSVDAQEKSKRLFFNVNGCRFEMVHVEGGSFLMGRNLAIPIDFSTITNRNYIDLPQDEPNYIDEMPRHGVELYSYYLGQYEVTQELWVAVMGYNPSNHIGDNYPVEQVSYNEVQEFISRLNKITGVTFRLPTEAEWEYAACGGSESNGYYFPGGNDLMNIGWNKINSEDMTHPVGNLIPNELGLYDMSGNVWEWCSDWYSPIEYVRQVCSHAKLPQWVKDSAQLIKWFRENSTTAFMDIDRIPLEHNWYDGTRYGSSSRFYEVSSNPHQNNMQDIACWTIDYLTTTLNPSGPDTGTYHVGRGGSWADLEYNLRPSYRNFWTSDKKISNLGFRLALSDNKQTTSNWMPNQYLVDSIVGNKLYTSSSTKTIHMIANGELPGAFSVSPTKHIHFSKGNLQYNAVSNTWRMADNQTDYIGINNLDYGSQYPGWIDLFAWGTSGYNNRPPYYFSTNSSYFGNGTNKNIDGTAYDWGIFNPIVNGGNKPGLWRTLSTYEWHYLFDQRPNAHKLSAMAKVGNTMGYLLLPDDWIERGLDSVIPGTVYQIKQEEWQAMERAGAVFLPAAGFCNFQKYTAAEPITGEIQIEGVNCAYGSLVPQFSTPIDEFASTDDDSDDSPNLRIRREYIQRANYREAIESNLSIGCYWTSTHYNDKMAMVLYFIFDKSDYIFNMDRATRCSVRLVKDIAENTGKTGKKGRR